MRDDNLPGQWTHADFEGGDPDERSYAQREADRAEVETPDYFEHRRRVVLGMGQDPSDVDLGPVGYDGFGAPLYAHQISPEGTE